MPSAADLFREIELAGLALDNTWKIRQNDFLDSRTSHIYRCQTIDELNVLADASSLTEVEKAYALHRWRNFKRHEAWLALLYEQVPNLEPVEQPLDKRQDFFIYTSDNKIPFDLKITRYPVSAGAGLGDRELAEWFYLNQSRQGRFHLANRFFVVGQPESALYNFAIARTTVSAFARNMASFRHFIEHASGESSRAVILRQTSGG